MTVLINRLAHAIAAITLLTAPLAASADDAATMDACIQTFVAASLPKDQPVRIFKWTDAARARAGIQDRSHRYGHEQRQAVGESHLHRRS